MNSRDQLDKEAESILQKLACQSGSRVGRLGQEEEEKGSGKAESTEEKGQRDKVRIESRKCQMQELGSLLSKYTLPAGENQLSNESQVLP